MENTMHPRLAGRLIPFLDGTPPEDVLRHHYKKLGGPAFVFNADKALDFLLHSSNWLTVRLTRGILQALSQMDDEEKEKNNLNDQLFHGSAGDHIPEHTTTSEAAMDPTLSFQEKIVYIQKVDIFKNLSINELAAISDIAQEVTFAPGDIVFHEKSFADTMYICVKGELAASRNNVDVGQFKAGDSFGMSAFLVDSKRLLTCRATTSVRLLEIHKQEFEEMLMEYPQISFQIAKIHARMIQRLLEQLREGGTHERLMKDFFNKDDLMK
jgi:CRP-like cAMP-binding protein